MPPVIGITQCLDDRERWRAGYRYLYLDHAYVEAVERAGGIPLFLPIQADAEALAAHVDALLLPGGDDFLPEDPYPADVRFEPAPPAQIEFDTRLLAAAERRALPVLGICYGMQLMALHHGGGLHHHLPADLPEAQAHDLPIEQGRHALEPVAGSRLADLLGDRPVQVNSRHHQAVRDPGDGMRVCGRSPDGVVEAIEGDGERFALGVQWHPEKLETRGGPELFDALVRACSRR